MSETAEKLLDEAKHLIANTGYNGFSYADLSRAVGIRKAGVHHHFPTKADLVVTVVERQREAIRAQISSLEEGTATPVEQIRAYLGYWCRCITDQSMSFCLAGVLAVELPVLPAPVADSVQGHFDDLRQWLERVFSLGLETKAITLELDVAGAAQFFQTTIYGAMVMARAYGDPDKFNDVADAFLNRMLVK